MHGPAVVVLGEWGGLAEEAVQDELTKRHHQHCLVKDNSDVEHELEEKVESAANHPPLVFNRFLGHVDKGEDEQKHEEEKSGRDCDPSGFRG